MSLFKGTKNTAAKENKNGEKLDRSGARYYYATYGSSGRSGVPCPEAMLSEDLWRLHRNVPNTQWQMRLRTVRGGDHMNARKLAFDALFAAVCAALGYFALDFLAVKVTFESLPVLTGGLLLGPVHGIIIGAVGTFIYQLLRYGLSYTTVLWMLPYIACGLAAGLYARSVRFSHTRRGVFITSMLCEFMITALNTGVIYVDSKLFGYYPPQLILGALALRIGIAAVKGALFGLVLPEILKGLKKAGAAGWSKAGGRSKTSGTEGGEDEIMTAPREGGVDDIR